MLSGVGAHAASVIMAAMPPIIDFIFAPPWSYLCKLYHRHMKALHMIPRAGSVLILLCLMAVQSAGAQTITDGDTLKLNGTIYRLGEHPT